MGAPKNSRHASRRVRAGNAPLDRLNIGKSSLVTPLPFQGRLSDQVIRLSQQTATGSYLPGQMAVPFGPSADPPESRILIPFQTGSTAGRERKRHSHHHRSHDPGPARRLHHPGRCHRRPRRQERCLGRRHQRRRLRRLPRRRVHRRQWRRQRRRDLRHLRQGERIREYRPDHAGAGRRLHRPGRRGGRPVRPVRRLGRRRQRRRL